MSWPQDGKPRYVVAQISGPVILDDDGGLWHGGYSGAEAYVYDRAHCHRIVRRFKYDDKRSALARAQLLAEALNAQETGAKLTRAQAAAVGHLA